MAGVIRASSIGVCAWLACLMAAMGSVRGADVAPARGRGGRAEPRWKDNTGMVFVRGGRFVRGGKHRVRVRSFYMDRYEVTNRRYCEFLSAGGAKHWNAKQEIDKTDGRFAPKPGKERWPVYCVSWPDAVAYAAWAHARLPTEAEWEYAAGGSDGRKYPWGSEAITPERANFGGKVGHPKAVGSYPKGKTPEGLFDLSGNVAEWCGDAYDPTYYAHAPQDSPPGPREGKRRVRRGGCFAMAAEDQQCAARGSSAADYRPRCIGIRCVRPARRVLLILGENFEEIEFAAFTGVLSWAMATRKVSNSVLGRSADAADLPLIEVVVAGFGREVRGMGGTRVRPDVLVGDLRDGDVDRFDAVAIPACVGAGRGRHTDRGQTDLLSPATIGIVRRVHANGGIIATMCWAETVLKAAKLWRKGHAAAYPLYTTRKDGAYRGLVYDEKLRTITSGSPAVATEAACLLLKKLVVEAEYKAFRRSNPWLFGIRDEFAPRLDVAK